MIKTVLTTLCLMYGTLAPAQKPPVDSSAFGKWPRFQDLNMSDDGRFLAYRTVTPSTKMSELTIRDKSAKWLRKIKHAGSSDVAISRDSKWVFFINTEDTLKCVALGGTGQQSIPEVQSFRLMQVDKHEYLVYLKKGTKDLVVFNLSSKESTIFPRVDNYWISGQGNTLLIKKTENALSSMERLKWVDFSSMREVEIWKGYEFVNPIFDNAGCQIIFFGKDADQIFGLYYRKIGMRSASRLLNARSPELINEEMDVTHMSPNFTDDGTHVIFCLAPAVKSVPPPKIALANVDVWNYKDEYIPSEQLSDTYAFSHSDYLYATINLADKKMIKLGGENEHLVFPAHIGNYLLLSTDPPVDIFYKKDGLPSLNIVSITDGKSKTIIQNKNFTVSGLSPDQQFVVWFDSDSLAYYSYEISTGITRNISRSTQVPLYDEDAAAVGRGLFSSFPIAAWEPKRNAVYVFDKYDLWKLDLRDERPPVNLTNGYGRKHKIVFSMADFWDVKDSYSLTVPKPQSLLAGFNQLTKENGFWKIGKYEGSNPTMLTMGNYCYDIPRVGAVGYVEYPRGMIPIKAKYSNTFLIERRCATSFPNLYLTKDFRSFQQITNVNPQKSYNWITSKLVNWKMPDGNISQGILYKPEDFDSTKKYPLIFTFYEKRSDQLNDFLLPDFSADRINIPFYVSNGYLVFVPDIYFRQDHNGEGTLNSIVSAAKYLSKFSWIDPARMGIQGHSFAGWETNFVITHTHLFAAACEASGVSDQISAYDQISPNGFTRQNFYERALQGSPMGMGVTPYSYPMIYAENSPVLFVEDVTTPLLMMHGDADSAVPFAQAIEMFLALKRAEKKVWLLQYENSGHDLYGLDAKDYTLRMKQFFDCYLKEAPPPFWMTHGIPAVEKGTESGLKLDYSGVQP